MAGCVEVSHPQIDTLYVSSKDLKLERDGAIATLYEHYSASKKDKEVYEVIAKKHDRFIINYAPGTKMLTLCSDPGSGWSRQYIDFDEAMLQMLIDDKVTFDQLDGFGTLPDKYDSLLVMNNPILNVKTNGSPTM
jgi:hypothetical protein